jgi:osmotically inducible protein OsmC
MPVRYPLQGGSKPARGPDPGLRPARIGLADRQARAFAEAVARQDFAAAEAAATQVMTDAWLSPGEGRSDEDPLHGGGDRRRRPPGPRPDLRRPAGGGPVRPRGVGRHGRPGTNPEQLFAVGYAACFQSALLSVAAGRGLDASASTITAGVGIGPTGHGGFGLTVALDLHAPRLARGDAEDLMARAHQRCPYSNATRGNVDVTLAVDGKRLERSAA